ncbi:hypothetical protein NP511_07540 [Natrinema thermotolerans]|uniref:Uncharacterized protein n=1 Tax=Natrinema thermotolerans TaxID=121872 RepID=A0AAF0T3J0_9EURY|nr:hypothetical protein [Natrinema thermotolerans]QCC58363.1 hypothetical protein DVR14_06780 [Natrinema thermotolerans]WMT09482.1 hypothetical protein NP511_07540 [Natrinema thermotolerans]
MFQERLSLLTTNKLLIGNALLLAFSGTVLYGLVEIGVSSWYAVAGVFVILSGLCHGVGIVLFDHRPRSLAGGGFGFLLAAGFVVLFAPITTDDALLVVGAGVWIVVAIPLFGEAAGLNTPDEHGE